MGALIPIAGIVWLGFVIWTDARRREREAFCRTELLKKVADNPGGSAQSVLDMMRHAERQAEIRKREGLKLGGLLVIAAGAGLIPFFTMIMPHTPIWAVGLIPLLIGIALYGYVRYLAPPVDQ